MVTPLTKLLALLVNTSYWPLALIELAAVDDGLLPIDVPAGLTLMGDTESRVRSSRISKRGRNVGVGKRRAARRCRRDDFKGI
jgi:hypothetical protein